MNIAPSPTLITDIAEQTNLLALNATIEAVRAGDSDKGFAVVPSRVKNLAGKTAKATEEISTQISEIRSTTNVSLDASDGIIWTVGNIKNVATSIALAIKQQGVATQEIARNVEQSAIGTKDVTINITGVNQATQETEVAADTVLGFSGELTEQSKNLRQKVDKFLDPIRAD